MAFRGRGHTARAPDYSLFTRHFIQHGAGRGDLLPFGVLLDVGLQFRYGLLAVAFLHLHLRHVIVAQGVALVAEAYGFRQLFFGRVQIVHPQQCDAQVEARRRQRAVDGYSLVELFDGLRVLVLLDEHYPEVEARVEDFRVYLYGRSELLCRRVEPFQLEVLHAQVVERHQILGIDREGLLEVLDGFVAPAFPEQVARPVELFFCRGRHRLSQLGCRDHAARGLARPGLAALPHVDRDARFASPHDDDLLARGLVEL